MRIHDVAEGEWIWIGELAIGRKWKRVGVAQGRKWIRHSASYHARTAQVPSDALPGARCVVGHLAERRLSSELKVERAVFQVIENAGSAAHHQFGISEHVPREAQTRSEIVVVGIHQR